MARGINLHPLYPAYSGMVNRCTNPNNSSYHLYGGRGITVCDRWHYGEDGKLGFWCWLADMGGSRPEGMTLDRIDTNGPYSPGNCRWASHKVQRINQSAEGKERQREGARAGAERRWEAYCAPDRTHCQHGHEFTPENKYVRRDGKFECRTCTLDLAAERRRKAGVPERNLSRHHSPRFQKAASTAIAARRA